MCKNMHNLAIFVSSIRHLLTKVSGWVWVGREEIRNECFTWSWWAARHRGSLFLLPPSPLLGTPPPLGGLLVASVASSASNDRLRLSSIPSFSLASLLILGLMAKPVPPPNIDGALGLEFRHLIFAIKGINSKMAVWRKSTIFWKQMVIWMKCVPTKCWILFSLLHNNGIHNNVWKQSCQIKFSNCVIFPLTLYLLLLRPTHHFLIGDSSSKTWDSFHNLPANFSLTQCPGVSRWATQVRKYNLVTKKKSAEFKQKGQS